MSTFAQIIFADANMEQAVRWASFGLFVRRRLFRCDLSLMLAQFNHGRASSSIAGDLSLSKRTECCCAGSRIYVESSVYDEFIKQLTEQVKKIKVGECVLTFALIYAS